MISNEIIQFHSNHLFPVFCEQVDAAIENIFVTGILWSTEAAREELNAFVLKAIEDVIRDRQPDHSICRVMRQTLQSR